ncbi:MAG: hypothetical protein CSA34_04105 [Desulfobulbus propionicus]|nr:MAG: hypothetical protein CSA34_04105 [Desulfobulbus propionicus]
MENLIGHFLLSTPQMPDPRFREQVIFMCVHNTEGAMGLVINNPNPAITMHEVLQGINISVSAGQLPPVYIGGPVEMEAGFILYRSPTAKDPYAMAIDNDIRLSRNANLLAAIARGGGPEEYLFMLGYAGWGPGQLEHELIDNSWLIVPGNLEILFHTPDELKWKKAAFQYGIDIALFGNVTGTA